MTRDSREAEIATEPDAAGVPGGGPTRAMARTAVVHVGLIGVAIGALLPWVTVGGLSRSGAGLANLSLSLADLGFSTPLSAVGFGWYAIPILALGAWLTLWRSFPPEPGRTTGAIAAILLVVAAVFWALVTQGPFLGSHIGATVSLAGAGISLIGCRYPRAKTTKRNTAQTKVSNVL